MLKLVPVSLFGLAFNALCNSIFILQIAKFSDSELLAHSMVMWSGFFVAGACVAPFENYFLYRRIGESHEEKHSNVVILSSILFLLVGISLNITEQASVWVPALTLLLGFCVGKMVYLRAKAISEKKLTRVSLSNSAEGLVRATAVFVMIQECKSLNLTLIIAAYLLGNLVSLIPVLPNSNGNDLSILESIPTPKFYSLGAIGLMSALITGGLPYIAGFFQSSSIASLLFFFTLSRSLLILQSLMVYVNPKFAKRFGEKRSLVKSFKFSTPLFAVIFILLIALKKFAEIFLDIDLNSIKLTETLFFTTALLLGALFNLGIATQNSGNKWKNSIYSGIVGIVSCCLAFKTIESSENAFYFSMVFAPLIGLLLLYYLERRSEIAE
jgi:hypothetical protein